MGIAVPFFVSMVAGKATSHLIGSLTGNDQLAMFGGMAAGAWAGGATGDFMAGASAPTGAEVSDVVAGGTTTPTTTPTTTTAAKPGLFSDPSAWVEKNPMKAQMMFGAAQGMSTQSMQQDLLEAQRRESEERYKREHQAFDPSKVRSLEEVNRGLFAGGYKPLSAQAREGIAPPELPNYKRLLEQYRG